MSQLFLLNRSPRSRDLTTAFFDRVRREDLLTDGGTRVLFAVQRAVAMLGHCEAPASRFGAECAGLAQVPLVWGEWVERWTATTTMTHRSRLHSRAALLKAGRWVADQHPEVADPAVWTRQTCAAWIAVVDRMKIGDYVVRTSSFQEHLGQPLQAESKAGLVRGVRVFFRDIQDWDWLPRQFDPQRALALPRSINALIGPRPRVIADEAWAKLLWAGLDLEASDVSRGEGGAVYPVETDPRRHTDLALLRSAQQRDRALAPGMRPLAARRGPVAGNSAQILARDAVCLLDVPAHKTGTAFTKPVDPLLGQTINAWEALRPRQPRRTDRRTGEQVDFLFSYRARSTIASQPYKAKEPMTVFELQAWLGILRPQRTHHRGPVDREAVASGAAAAGKPWQHYDLGHGYCTYTFFEQCPHRMACARCDFCTPKESSKAQLPEAKDNLQRIRATIPLTDEEEAAVADGRAALNRLLENLADVPTPSGPTPRQLLPTIIIEKPSRSRPVRSDRTRPHSRGRSEQKLREIGHRVPDDSRRGFGLRRGCVDVFRLRH
ncbi:tyrosine-type recombinase/integrase [Streptomyces sp. NPDC002276]